MPIDSRSGLPGEPAQRLLPLRWAQRLLLLQALLLVIGTQIPGPWRATLEAGLQAPFGLASWGHFTLFAGMAALATTRPLAWPWQRVLLLGLVLALATEGMQFFALERHPRWLDVGIDMGGALAGMALAALVNRRL